MAIMSMFAKRPQSRVMNLQFYTLQILEVAAVERVRTEATDRPESGAFATG